MKYLISLKSELRKLRRSNVFWFCCIAGLFVPVIRLIAGLVTGHHINEEGEPGWLVTVSSTFKNMGNFLLPMIVVLAASMITHLEEKNNSWKQLHASPQSYGVIFASKVTMVLLVVLTFLLFFTLCLCLAVTTTCLFLDGQLPNESIPLMSILELVADYFWVTLPIVFFQFALSIFFKNFLASVGIGLLGLIGSLLALAWSYKWLLPFSYTINLSLGLPKPDEFHLYLSAHILLLGVGGFLIYRFKKDKG